MKTYSIEEFRNIAAETGDPETVARFEKYISDGLVAPVTGISERQTGKFKPMLAIKASLKQVKAFPVIGSFKYDGIRGIFHPEFGLISRDSKPIANRYIRETIESTGISHLDGEILTFTNGKQDKLNTIVSKVNAEEGEPHFIFLVFDDFEFPELPYEERLNNARKKWGDNIFKFMGITPYWVIRDKEQLERCEEKASKNSEGFIVRKPKAPYKNGKSTIKEGGIFKIKRTLDDEGVILEINQISNGLEMIGSFVLSWNGIVFNLGNGWTDEEAEAIWAIRGQLKGQKVTFRYQDVGANGAPRFSTFVALRYDV